MKKLIICFVTILLHIAAHAQKEGLIHNGSAKIYYRIYGEGKPLLIINGGPGMNSDGFAALAAHLSKNCMAIIYDQRGTGKSSVENADSSNITMELMTEDIETLRKHLNIDKWIILGHSFGGMMASYYATKHPGNIGALILSSSGGIDLDLLSYVPNGINSKLSKTETDSINYWTNRINAGDTSYHARLRRGFSLATAYLYNRKYIPVIAERLTQGNTLIQGLVWQDLQRINFDCSEKLSSFNKPVLIIQGKQDIIEERTAIKEHAVLKNSKVVLMDKCVHYGWLDRPYIYYDEVEKFIQNN